MTESLAVAPKPAEQILVAFGQDRDALLSLRKHVRDHAASSALFDSADALNAALRAMHEMAVSGQHPHNFDVGSGSH